MKKTIFIVIVLLGVGIYLFSSKKDVPTADTSQFRFVLTSEPPTLDWSLATDNVSADIIFNLMEGLVEYDQNLNIIPALAERWEISPDGKTYTFYLKQHVQWSDGKPLTASDFVYGWQRLLDPKTASDYAYFLFDVQNAKEFNSGKITNFDQVGVHAKSSHTLVVQLWHPASYFLKIPTFWSAFPLRKDIVEKHGNDWATPQVMATLGPYFLKEWNHDYKITLEANPHYYGEKPKIEKVVAYIVNEDSTALSLYETQKIDLLRKINPLVISKYKEAADFRQGPFLRGYYYGFHTQKAPFNDIRIRKAFAHAVDRSEFPKILQGNQIPITSWIPKGMMGYAPDIGCSFDIKKAKALLAEAGYPNGKNFPKASMVFDSRDDNKVVAENLHQQWKEHLNVDLDVQNQEWKVYLKQLETNPPHLWRLGWGADFPDPDNFMSVFTSYSGNNLTRWKNTHYDKLIEKAAQESRDPQRLLYYNEAQRLLTELDVAIIPLFVESQNVLVKPHIGGYEVHPMGYLQIKNLLIKNHYQ